MLLLCIGYHHFSITANIYLNVILQTISFILTLAFSFLGSKKIKIFSVFIRFETMKIFITIRKFIVIKFVRILFSIIAS